MKQFVTMVEYRGILPHLSAHPMCNEAGGHTMLGRFSDESWALPGFPLWHASAVSLQYICYELI
jgi:hypothetical protein